MFPSENCKRETNQEKLQYQEFCLLGEIMVVTDGRGKSRGLYNLEVFSPRDLWFLLMLQVSSLSLLGKLLSVPKPSSF
jgi:hypothetical protein